ncbi:MAG: phage morphogenesis protein [Capnocytophaga sp.]|nr:phage morphogenesis protein [Capnocytophaga sp.]
MKDNFKKIADFIKNDLPKVVEVEGLKFIAQNFQDEGFHDGSLQKWKPRKTTDRKGRDITRYRTDRKGRAGNLNKYGQKNEGRAILTGHNTGGNKLRHSFKTRSGQNKVVFYTHKESAERHNEGTNGMPKRQFIGKSETLRRSIKKEVERILNQLLK